MLLNVHVHFILKISSISQECQVRSYWDYLNLSCPAVSQICNFIFCPATSIILVPNSTPIVWGQSAITWNKKKCHYWRNFFLSIQSYTCDSFQAKTIRCISLVNKSLLSYIALMDLQWLVFGNWLVEPSY